MNKQRRSLTDLAIDEATAADTLNDADLSSAVVVYPAREKKVAIKINIEDEIIQLCKRIAAVKHFDTVSKLLDSYIRKGVEKDKELLKRI